MPSPCPPEASSLVLIVSLANTCMVFTVTRYCSKYFVYHIMFTVVLWGRCKRLKGGVK